MSESGNEKSDENKDLMNPELQAEWSQKLRDIALGPIANKIRLIVKEKLNEDGRMVVDFDTRDLDKSDLARTHRSSQRVALKIRELLEEFLIEKDLCSESDQLPLKSVVANRIQFLFRQLDFLPPKE